MTVLCSIPVQIPVHRIRVTAKCLATGGPVHTATLRLMDYWGESPEEIAEVLGLAISYVKRLIGHWSMAASPSNGNSSSGSTTPAAASCRTPRSPESR